MRHPITLLLFFTLSAVLISCGETGNTMPPSADTVLAHDTGEPADTGLAEETHEVHEFLETAESAETAEELPETAESAEETSPPESHPETVPPEPVPLILPDDMQTNITDPAAGEILLEIYGKFAQYPDAAVHFSDVDGKFSFGIREDMEFHSASTIKAPYCQYLISSGTDLNQTVVFTESTRTSASEKLTALHVGTTFTVDELIGYTIRDSDNQAYRLLLDTFGSEGYNQWAQSIGVPGLALADGEWAVATPRELSAAMMEIHRTGESNPVLTDHMKNTSFNAQISAGTAYENAHKYGYNGGADGYHDTAIVYAPGRAYVLTVMTHLEFGGKINPNTLFRETAALCDRLHAVLFGH